MADSDKAKQSDSAPVDTEKLLSQAQMALKTGISAYENENFVFAETLLVKALDLFEQANKLEEKGYFQCLHQIADTYFQLGRYFEAKSYYERLSVARLKNPASTDAQVVVALLKLASTYEKLGEAAEALTAFDLIMELAEKTIPNGHALFGVIFDSYEDLINRQIADVDERERRETIILQKREQFGFSKIQEATRIVQAASQPAAAQGEGDSVLSQAPEELRKNLKAWTDVDMMKPAALEEAVQRAKMEHLASLQERQDHGREESTERHVQAHLHPDMFKRKPHADKDDESMEIVEKELGADDPGPAVWSEAGEAVPAATDASAPSASSMRRTSGGGGAAALKGVKRPNTDRRRFNPLPALTVTFCLSLVGGAVFFAHEYVKNNAITSTTVANLGALDYTGRSWVASDSHKMLRCLGPYACEYTVGDASASGLYTINGQAGQEKSIISDFLNGHPAKLTFDEVSGGLKAADGTMLYSEDSKDRLVLNKAQAIANFATYYFASHGHVYPARAEDFQFGNAKFAWENPITGQTNKPVVKMSTHTKADFDGRFTGAVKDMRNCKPVFDVDSETGSLAGLIECMALMPAIPASSGANPNAPGTPPADTSAVDEAGCAFLIRAYDAEGKMIMSSDPKMAFVIALKNGISIDPVKVLHDEAAPAQAPTGKVDVLINPLPASTGDKKHGTK